MREQSPGDATARASTSRSTPFASTGAAKYQRARDARTRDALPAKFNADARTIEPRAFCSRVGTGVEAYGPDASFSRLSGLGPIEGANARSRLAREAAGWRGQGSLVQPAYGRDSSSRSESRATRSSLGLDSQEGRGSVPNFS